MNTNNTIMGEIAKNMSTNNMIMSEIAKAPENYEDKKEALQSAIDNQKMIESMARYKAAHTPIIKKYKTLLVIKNNILDLIIILCGRT